MVPHRAAAQVTTDTPEARLGRGNHIAAATGAAKDVHDKVGI
jgi:hypothetical protein